jgi:hypothetical protein
MPGKKAATRTKKTPRGKKPTMGLTSALGPKATTMVVIVVIAGSVMIASRQQQAKAKERLEAARADVVLTADPVATPKRAMAAPAANAPADAPADAPAATTGVTAAAKAPVTVSGCLERTDEGFRLRETSGADAPKARSWKSGFLKKSAATLDVVDPGRTLALADHVGRRVSLTGTMTDREMRARSIRRIGECKAN